MGEGAGRARGEISVSYNGSLAASAATTFGFQATANGPFTVPTLSCTAN